MSIHEIIEDNICIYVICELVHGGDLENRLTDNGPFEEEEKVATIIR